MVRRTVGVLVAFVMAALPLVAAPHAVAQEQGGSDEPTTVRVALNGYENNLTPFTITFATGRPDDLMMMIYDSLFWSQVSEDPEPWLAESATPSNDFRTWTVTLRSGVRWHDGRPLTAEDVKFTFDYFEEVAPPGRWTHHVTDEPPYERGEVVDDRTVRLHFARPAPTFPILPGADLPILPKHIWEGVENPRTATDMLPIGSGPYQLTEIVPDQRYRFEANEDYFKGTPLVDVIEMPIVTDANAAFQALQTGQVDYVARDVPPAVVERFEASDDIEVVRGTDFESAELQFNTRRPGLDDPRVRKAMSLAIDYDALVEQVLQGDGQPGRDSWVHPRSPWAMPDGGHEFDPQRAEQLLDEAGYRPGSDGVRVGPDGTRLDFEVLVSSFEPEGLRGLQLAARQVQEIGVRLQPVALDPAALRERTSPGPDGPPTHDAEMAGFDWHAHTDPDALYFFFHSPGSKGIGAIFTAWSNREFDQLVERATRLPADARKPLLHEAQRIMAQEVPVLTFWYRDGVEAYRPAAYDGWVTDFGHGVLSKRSFLRPYAQSATATAPAGEDGGNTAWWIVPAAGGALVVVTAGLLLWQRRRRATAEEQGFE
jgi:peptide/nickel transport system substrate-binding protein